jgi:A/G-specific adenine glycosylase
MRSFAARVVAWQRRHGRAALPWSVRDPYRVWLSEIMLQQTQVRTVIPYYDRFVARFPDIEALAHASREDVMRLWAGLGYYSRARYLHECARRIVEEERGVFPLTAAAIAELPGIGRSTAAAIAAFCFDERVPILDGNVKRVLARHRGIEGDPSTHVVEQRFWEHAQSLLPAARQMSAYTQGLMDLGATLCTRATPACARCPVRQDCYALKNGRVEQLPSPRRRKEVPVRRAHLLLVVDRGAVLLEQRPPRGIWGGLLAPPQFATKPALRAALDALASGSATKALPPRRHGFTHFTLAYTPHVVHVSSRGAAARDPTRHWVRFAELASAPLPAPIRVLLAEIKSGEERRTRGARVRAR